MLALCLACSRLQQPSAEVHLVLPTGFRGGVKVTEDAKGLSSGSEWLAEVVVPESGVFGWTIWHSPELA